MKVTFIIWYNDTTPQIVESLKSIVASAGPTKISIIAVKTSAGRQLEDSAVRWTPGCKVMYMPGSSRKLAWQQAVRNIIADKSVEENDFFIFCDPFFIAETPIFNQELCESYYRIYIPYSSQYGEKEALDSSKLVKFNGGGSMIMVSRHAFYNFKNMPEWLENYCLDCYIIDHLSALGYTCHKIPGCYVQCVKNFPLSPKERKIYSSDLFHYQSWVKVKGGYNKIIAAQMKRVAVDEYTCSEENCD